MSQKSQREESHEDSEAVGTENPWVGRKSQAVRFLIVPVHLGVRAPEEDWIKTSNDVFTKKFTPLGAEPIYEKVFHPFRRVKAGATGSAKRPAAPKNAKAGGASPDPSGGEQSIGKDDSAEQATFSQMMEEHDAPIEGDAPFFFRAGAIVRGNAEGKSEYLTVKMEGKRPPKGEKGPAPIARTSWEKKPNYAHRTPGQLLRTAELIRTTQPEVFIWLKALMSEYFPASGKRKGKPALPEVELDAPAPAPKPKVARKPAPVATKSAKEPGHAAAAAAQKEGVPQKRESADEPSVDPPPVSKPSSKPSTPKGTRPATPKANGSAPAVEKTDLMVIYKSNLETIAKHLPPDGEVSIRKVGGRPTLHVDNVKIMRKGKIGSPAFKLGPLSDFPEDEHDELEPFVFS